MNNQTNLPPAFHGAPPDLLSVKQFCRAYGVGRSTVYRLLAEGALSARKVGRLTKIPREQAEAWKAALPSYQGSGRINPSGGHAK